MAKGGIYDHLGGGFHRYTTDREWQIPHFEKMLYDQAILSRTYLEAYQITKKEPFATTAREIFDYVLRDMQHSEGGFYSAEDADSLDPDEFTGMTPDSSQKLEKKEGAFYVWRAKEIEKILGKDDSEIFNYHLGIEPHGNAHSDPHGEFTGKNIIYVANDIEATAEHFQKEVVEIEKAIQRSKIKLFGARNDRPRPYLDDKILVDWNGLMISSLAFGARVLNEPKYMQAAEKSAQLILNKLKSKDGRLLHRYREGDAAIMATIEDYAFLIHGLLDLYEATFKVLYLENALRLANEMVDLFWDDTNGGFYFTADDAETLLFRPKEIYDGAIPSGNSVAALDLVRLSHITLDKKWDQKLEKLFEAFYAQLSQQPSAYAQMMTAFDFAVGPSQEIVLAADPDDPGLSRMVDEIYSRFIPNKVVILREASADDAKAIIAIAPFVENQLPLDGKATAYICENHVCKLPVNDIGQLQSILDGPRKAK